MSFSDRNTHGTTFYRVVLHGEVIRSIVLGVQHILMTTSGQKIYQCPLEISQKSLISQILQQFMIVLMYLFCTHFFSLIFLVISCQDINHRSRQNGSTRPLWFLTPSFFSTSLDCFEREDNQQIWTCHLSQVATLTITLS